MLRLACRPHPTDPKHPDALDDALALLDAARDAALFEGTPPALGSPSTEVRQDREERAVTSSELDCELDISQTAACSEWTEGTAGAWATTSNQHAGHAASTDSRTTLCCRCVHAGAAGRDCGWPSIQVTAISKGWAGQQQSSSSSSSYAAVVRRVEVFSGHHHCCVVRLW